ncbi:hypothetical protein [Acidovorax sp. Root402]|uniref:hypothetical protein n=1 Tax=Acidovorax sp. Root402 TaxID=1736527 RepID=UPI0006F6E959|nr:hypothetical protein [Acidovorax sp. Root402]KQW24857.1 hypothetical protein ASC83_12030 [Acidovorax sp. Root402]
MKKKPTILQPAQRAQSSVIDVLEEMLSRPETKALMAEPGVKVIESRDVETGRVTYSFRSPDDPSYDEDATPNG